MSHLRAIVQGLQSHLEGSLKGNRAAVVHPGGRGEAAEEDWLRVLKAHLPQRYQADKAFVIDSRGELSDQIDVVIYDRQFSPCLYNQSDQRFVPAESVYAVFEVKQDLSLENVRYAGAKAASVRRLHRTSGGFAHLGGTQGPGRALPQIAAGLLAYQSSWSPAFGSPFDDALAALSADHSLELGCVLVDGAFEADYAPGRAPSITVAPGDRSLVEFLLRLLRLLQLKGSAPAIDYGAYLAAIAIAVSPTA
ncbi:MAG TPA: DUF6602 domain-containing protein [Candidatus Nitrosotalea sp.]|nr:DUF6602 domain-containing protein [Candidatus Nitrosotalea sp.]